MSDQDTAARRATPKSPQTDRRQVVRLVASAETVLAEGGSVRAVARGRGTVQHAVLLAGAHPYTFARQGITLTSPDTNVAAVAHHRRARVLTGNLKHFPMTDITVEEWAPYPA